MKVTIIVIIMKTIYTEVTWILLFLTYIGYYCDRQEAIDEEQSGVGAPSHGVKIPKICPIGFYCPNGTETAGQYPCNDGTYSNSTGLEMFEQCLPCTEGHYCTAENITAPTGILSVYTIDLISIYWVYGPYRHSWFVKLVQVEFIRVLNTFTGRQQMAHIYIFVSRCF